MRNFRFVQILPFVLIIVVATNGIRAPLGSAQDTGDSVRKAKEVADSTPLKLIATINGEEFRPLEPIVVKVDIRNLSKHPYRLPHHGTWSPEDDIYTVCNIVVKDSTGREVPGTVFELRGVNGFVRGGKPETLWPGKSLELSLVANLMKDMTLRGKYTIVVEVFYCRADSDQKKWDKAHSDTLNVRVDGAVRLDAKSPKQ